MDCIWIKNGDNFKCKNCGFIVDHPNYKRNCRKVNNKKKEIKRREVPPFHKRVFNFAKAAINHELKGRPQCTEEEIQSRLKICKNCELFKPRGDGGICSHENCGCNLKSEKQYLNKLAWADQECPLKKWTKIEKNPENGV